MIRPRPALQLATTILIVAFLAACSSSEQMPTAPEARASVKFEYRAATAVDSVVDFQTCTPEQVIFTVHLHFIWVDWEERRNMTAEGAELWTLSDSIPAERLLNVALHDPNNCLTGGVYVAPQNLFANGVLLTRIVDVQEGTGLSFTVLADGTVQP